MLWRKLPGDVAKVGVGGSNPLARSNYIKGLGRSVLGPQRP